MALAVKKNFRIHQMDVITAFLQGDLKEEIFMEQPEAYHNGSNLVCKLNRSVYGLKQAGRQWNLKLDNALKKFGLIRSLMDPCIYYTKKMNLLIAIYVDDFLIFYTKLDELNDLKKFLNETFKMKDLGPAKHCIGINIKQTGKGIELNQTRYIEEVLNRFRMQDCKPVKNPSDTNQKLSVQLVTEENSLVGKVPYQELVGCLLFLSQATRPDIAFAVNNVSRFNNKHSEIHWQAVKRILRYLNGTKHHKLCYTKEGDSELHAYSDADWASDVDKRLSCTGFVVNLSNGAINWSSKRQQIVALSSTEAEYIALSSTVRDVIWIKQLLGEIDKSSIMPTTIFCDNQSAIKLGEIEAYRPRTKHIDIRYHHLRQKINEGIIELKYISTKEMTADSLTKAVPAEKHALCTSKMGLKSIN